MGLFEGQETLRVHRADRGQGMRAGVASIVAAAVDAARKEGLILTEALPEVILERPKREDSGDFSTNIAMLLAPLEKKPPRDVAKVIADKISAHPDIEKCDVAGPGFINLFLKKTFWLGILEKIISKGADFGKSAVGAKKKVQVEFVSANPTGPLPVGHGRGAAFGASLANVLAARGFDVQREFYVNDAGRQMDILVLSTWLRYLEEGGTRLAFPANAYQGDYVRQMAHQIRIAHGARYRREVSALFQHAPDAAREPEAGLDALIAGAKSLLGADYAYIHDFVLAEQLGDCRHDLLEFGVSFDQWFSEKSLYDSGLVERAN